MNNILIDLSQKLLQGKENTVFSPASLLYCLSTINECIFGENKKELLEKLNLTDSELNSINLSKEVETYDALFYNQDFEFAINQNILRQIKDFGVDISKFVPDITFVNSFNSLVSEKTHGKIENLLSLEDLNPLIKLIILNCVYFKKNWLRHESLDYWNTNFNGENGLQKCQYFSGTYSHRFYEDSEVNILEMPYRDSEVSAYFILSHKDCSLEDNIYFLSENLSKIKLVKSGGDVKYRIPCFKTESSFPLVENLKNLGLNNIFTPNKDWSLVDFNSLDPAAEMWINDIKQKAYIKMDEKGTEATAATTALLLTSGFLFFERKIKEIIFDRPFMYVLADRNNLDIPLFIGSVRNL